MSVVYCVAIFFSKITPRSVPSLLFQYAPQGLCDGLFRVEGIWRGRKNRVLTRREVQPIKRVRCQPCP